MIYGLYLSATGVLANSYRQDVIANNLANAETIGFKRDLTSFRQRLTEAGEQRRNPRSDSNELLEGLGGGFFVSPSAIDTTQGDMEQTQNPLDVAVVGAGYFAVRAGGQMRLTRDGRFSVNRLGRLITESGHEVLDTKRQPIAINQEQPVSIDKDGFVLQGGGPVAQLGTFDVADPSRLRKIGNNLLASPDNRFNPISATLSPGSIERSNVDPTSELTKLMDAQRQLEVNANMIRYQDQTLGRLVSEVGKIS